MGMSTSAENQRRLKAEWEKCTLLECFHQSVPIFLAQEKGLRVAVLQAQGLKRGMKKRFGFDVKVGQFLAADHKSKIQRHDDLIAFSLHLYSYEVAREMVHFARAYVQWLAEGKIEHNDNALSGLVGVRMKLMEAFPAYYLFVVKRKNEPEAALHFLCSYVRSGLKRRAPKRSGSGTAEAKEVGAEMDWARAVRLAHPEKKFEEALQLELPAEVAAKLSEIQRPYQLSTLRTKVSEGLWSQLADQEQRLKQAARRAKKPEPVMADIGSVKINPIAEIEAKIMVEQLLNKTELELFRLECAGFSLTEIASRLNKAYSTVANQRANYRAKIRRSLEDS